MGKSEPNRRARVNAKSGAENGLLNHYDLISIDERVPINRGYLKVNSAAQRDLAANGVFATRFKRFRAALGRFAAKLRPELWRQTSEPANVWVR